MNWFKSLFAQPLPDLAVQSPNCQAIGKARKLRRAATVNGLLSAVDAGARARYEAKVAAVLRARLSA